MNTSRQPSTELEMNHVTSTRGIHDLESDNDGGDEINVNNTDANIANEMMRIQKNNINTNAKIRKQFCSTDVITILGILLMIIIIILLSVNVYFQVTISSSLSNSSDSTTSSESDASVVSGIVFVFYVFCFATCTYK